MLFCEQLKRVLHTQPWSYLQTEQTRKSGSLSVCYTNNRACGNKLP
jgi:hypothetical protein